MRTTALAVLIAVAVVSITGCHWRHRRWRNYHDRSYNSQPQVDHVVSAEHPGSAAV